MSQNIDGLVSSKEAWEILFPTGAMCWRSFQTLMIKSMVPRIKIGGKNFMHVPTVWKHLQKKYSLEALEV